MHLNIRSLNKHITDLHTFLSTLPFKPDVISLSKVRIHQPLQNIDICWYNLIHAKSNYGQAGEVAVYTNVWLRFAQMKSFLIRGSKSIWLKVGHQESIKTLVISTVYRHPKENVNQFVEDFSECLEKLTSVNSTFYILGNINININKSSLESSLAKRYTDAITSSGAVPIITLPTHITDNLSTVIDYIITNDLSRHVTPCVIRSPMTNHYNYSCV